MITVSFVYTNSISIRCAYILQYHCFRKQLSIGQLYSYCSDIFHSLCGLHAVVRIAVRDMTAITVCNIVINFSIRRLYSIFVDVNEPPNLKSFVTNVNSSIFYNM